MIVSVQEAKTQISRLLKRVEQGEEIVIARAGKPVAKLVPYRPTRSPRTPGGWKGKVWMADDFDDLPAELVAAFDGEDDTVLFQTTHTP